MSAISVGRIVVKIMGREAGKKAVVTQLLDKNFVEITGPFELSGVKRRRVNIAHIEPTEHTIDLKLNKNSDKDVMSLLDANSEIKSVLES